MNEDSTTNSPTDTTPAQPTGDDTPVTPQSAHPITEGGNTTGGITWEAVTSPTTASTESIPDSPMSPQSAPATLTASFGTILTGVFLIGWALVIVLLVTQPQTANLGIIVIGGILVTGILLLSAGIAAALRKP
ncbi:hypothetical protein GCM10022198_21350 [Klugiella xanthotipulae]|uniref:Uncharacterized protein n=1 Tax=Klugiella xanthotipulae TaxID=244735 RepID=A0A543HY09_9MICO|nr:hypothetical protein [Klugiella xanthotipulae]TQM63222.1 hypothetical protein FB466_1478 [Klugiella xanthotipulae]